jgi:hypothetical protein
MVYFPETFVPRMALSKEAFLALFYFALISNVLFSRLQDACVVCYLGQWFVGALAYADDIILLTPTTHVMRKMLTLCDDFVDENCVQFNVM